MAYYTKHIFFCTNQKSQNRACCANHQADDMRNYMKRQLKNSKRHGAGKCRVNLAGCMGRCQQGPVLVVYPEGVWYSYSSIKDIDEIIEKHIMKGIIVERLLLSQSALPETSSAE